MTSKLDVYKLKNGNNISPHQIIAYFDFDGTLTAHDTLIPFIIYTSGRLRLLLSLPILLIIILLYFTKIISNERSKEFFLILTLSNVPRKRLEYFARRFALEKLDKYIKPEIYSRLEYHLEHKHQVMLVSANLGLYLRYWAEKHHLDGVIATEIEFNSRDLATGRLATRNCYGAQKVKRIKQWLSEAAASFTYSYGYGNSRGDFELLGYVDEGHWVKGEDIITWEDYRNEH